MKNIDIIVKHVIRIMLCFIPYNFELQNVSPNSPLIINNELQRTAPSSTPLKDGISITPVTYSSQVAIKNGILDIKYVIKTSIGVTIWTTFIAVKVNKTKEKESKLWSIINPKGDDNPSLLACFPSLQSKK